MIEREVSRLLLVCAEAWPSVPVRSFDREVQLRTWGAILADVTLVEAEAVVVEYARRGEAYPPAPGQIAEAVLTMRERASGLPAPDIDLALIELQEQIRRAGRDGAPKWSHPEIISAVKAIGWGNLCNSTSFDHVRGQFIKAYEAAVARMRERRRYTAAYLALIQPKETNHDPTHHPDLGPGDAGGERLALAAGTGAVERNGVRQPDDHAEVEPHPAARANRRAGQGQARLRA